MNDWVNEWIDAPTNPGKIILNVIYPLLGVTAPACSKGKGPTLFYLAAGIKLKRAKGIHETKKKQKKHARVKIYLPITEQLYQSHSSAVKRLNTICCHDLTIHLWLHWKSPFIITGADWRGGGGHGGLFPRIQCARVGGVGGGSTNEIYCETKRPHNAQITNRSYSIWQAHNVQCIKHKHAWPRSELQKRPT